MRRAADVRWSVYPRYSCGSPAQVDEATARKVAVQERQGYEAAADGTYGAREQEVARQLGLRGIVLALSERGGKFDVRDEMTGICTYKERPEQFALDRAQEQAQRNAILKGGE